MDPRTFAAGAWSACWPAPCPGCRLTGTEGFCPGCRAAARAPLAARVGEARLLVLAAGSYRGGLRRAILALKQGDRPDLARSLAALFPGPPPGAPLLVPVPTSPDRVRARGYDHALLLARHLARTWGCPVSPRVLRRTRATPRLHASGPGERRRLLRGAFAAVRSRKTAEVWLVDDLCTTGATLDGCRSALGMRGWDVRGAVVLARACSGMR
ncbi:MAG: ComF family protein [Candidatus Sericytochromatia bacterium]|nr:ComF family protein [Candidatus Sericytochromatia bacterium]